MKNNFDRNFWCLRAILAGIAMLFMSGVVFAQEFTVSRVSSPITPDLITPPVGNSAFLEGHGIGTQGYVCLPNGLGGAAWTVNARPEATLFTNILGEAVQIITHFLSPVENPNGIGPNPPRFGDVTWQSSFDSSRVWAQKEHFITAGTDRSCPNNGAIDCLLLQVIGSAGRAYRRKVTYKDHFHPAFEHQRRIRADNGVRPFRRRRQPGVGAIFRRLLLFP